MTEFSSLFLLSGLIASSLMLAVWGLCTVLRNAGFVDAAWSFSFSILALLYLSLGGGYFPRRLLLCAMIFFWSVRLGTHLLRRLCAHHPEEDVRYRALREKWASFRNLKFFLFFQAQALLAVLLAAPVLWVSLNPAPRILPLEWAALLLWLGALAGETLADSQLKEFRANPSNRGKVCRVGLWRYSRHPNYFFEWLVWIAYFLFALATPRGWIFAYAPALMFFFLYYVTGIPAAEEQSLKSKGEEYRKYQAATSAFIPWFPKTA